MKLGMMFLGLGALILTSGCANPPASEPLCAETLEARQGLRDALLATDDLQAKRSGLVALEKIQAGCI